MQDKRRLICKVIGILLCTVPAVVMTLAYFPLWLGEEKTALSILSVLVLALCAIPFRRVLAQALRSPSAWQMWLVLWLALTILESISAGLRAVSAVAFPCSLAGAWFFRIANGSKTNEDDKHGKR